MQAQQSRSKVLAPGEGKITNVLGVRVDILLSGEETGGAQCVYAAQVLPGEGPPPHLHLREDETFYVLEGEFDILCGEEWRRVGPGYYCYVAPGTWHTFKNVGQTTGRLLSNSTPAGHERFFEEVDRLSRHAPLSIEETLAVCQRHGMEVMPPPPAATHSSNSA